MIFGRKSSAADDDEDDDDEDRDLVAFQGPLNGKDVDLKANARLAQVALIPAKVIITDAIERRAEQVKIELKGDRAQVTMYVDGVAYSGGKMAKPQAVALMQMLKVFSGLDPKLKGQTQNGGLKVQFQDVSWEVTLDAAQGPEASERVILRLRNLKLKLSTLEELNYPTTIKPLIRETTAHRQGVVLIGGVSGSGVTTLTYAIIRGLDMYMYSVFTIVEMGSREIYNVTKFEKNEGDEYQFTMERMIRSEADVIFVDPIRTPEAAKAVANVADRVCVIGEAAGKDAASTITEFAKNIGDNAKAGELFRAAFSQKLIRTLCSDCREAFRPNPKLLAKVGLPPETKVLYRKPEPEPDPKTGELPDPCEKCAGVGYYGRIAMVEIITGSETIKKLISQGATADQIKAQARGEGMQTFHKDGLRLVAEGKTSLEELQRLFKA